MLKKSPYSKDCQSFIKTYYDELNFAHTNEHNLIHSSPGFRKLYPMLKDKFLKNELALINKNGFFHGNEKIGLLCDAEDFFMGFLYLLGAVLPIIILIIVYNHQININREILFLFFFSGIAAIWLSVARFTKHVFDFMQLLRIKSVLKKMSMYIT